jgi:hypothetical protein
MTSVILPSEVVDVVRNGKSERFGCETTHFAYMMHKWGEQHNRDMDYKISAEISMTEKRGKKYTVVKVEYSISPICSVYPKDWSSPQKIVKYYPGHLFEEIVDDWILKF